MAVVDASVVVGFLTEPDRVLGGRALDIVARGAEAPYLVDAEVGHVLRRRVLRDVLSASAGAAALVDLALLPIAREPHAPLLGRAWELRDNLSFYDALYVALAERLTVPLFTFDQRLAGAPGLRCEIEVL